MSMKISLILDKIPLASFFKLYENILPITFNDYTALNLDVWSPKKSMDLLFSIENCPYICDNSTVSGYYVH